MSSKIYLRILQGGLIISLFFVLFVFADLLFPYISSKQISFNILMELLFAFWVVLIWRYPSYRPKLNLMVVGLISYFAIILLSCFTGVDFNLSFWGDVERMLGFFHLLHFLIFFFILITVFRTWKEWQILFLASITAAVIVSLIGLLGKHGYSTIGNTAYVSGYLIFNIFFATILFFRTRNNWRYLYFIPTIIMLLQFKNMHTSGAIIGLAASIFMAMLLIGIFHSQKKIKYSFLTVCALMVIIVAIIFSQQQATWFQNSFLRNLTSQKTTFQTRLLSWQGAARDFKYHPLLGTGFGNYAIIFDRQFNPKFFDYDRVETYFDRAHNNLIDIISTTGLAGFITYLSILIFALYYLWCELKKNGKKINQTEAGRRNLEIVVVVALMTAYFIQNLAVFDSFVTYIGLMIMIGFIYWLPNDNAIEADREVTVNSSWLKDTSREWLALIVLLIISLIVVSNANLKPYRMLKGVIDGYSFVIIGRTEEGFNIFRESLTGTALDRDGRATLINLVAGNPELLASLSSDKLQTEYEYLVLLAEKNAEYNEKDNLFQLQLAQVYDLGSRLFNEDEIKRDYYSNLSLLAADKAVAASPGRIPVYFVKAQSLLMQGRSQEAIETLQYAISLNPKYPHSYCRLAQIYMQTKSDTEVIPALEKCIDAGAVNQIGSSNALILAATYLANNKDYLRAITVVERLSGIYSDDAEVWFNLTKLYTLVGNTNKARATAARTIQLDPAFKEQIDQLFAE
ncbi:MAG: O-antigen ligase family protein [Patescibacteria group bacterium]